MTVFGIVAEGPVADHRVVGGVGDVDDRCEIDSDAKVFHRAAALQRDVMHLLDGLRLGEHPRSGLVAR